MQVLGDEALVTQLSSLAMVQMEKKVSHASSCTAPATLEKPAPAPAEEVAPEAAAAAAAEEETRNRTGEPQAAIPSGPVPPAPLDAATPTPAERKEARAPAALPAGKKNAVARRRTSEKTGTKRGKDEVSEALVGTKAAHLAEAAKEEIARRKKKEEINSRMAKVMEDARNGPTSSGLIAMMKEAMRNEVVDAARALPGRTEGMDVPKVHYILHTPMEGPWSAGLRICVLATGCFWGSEKGFWRLPCGGIHSTAVGYAAGYTPNPDYNEVCSGRTGATEAVQVVFDPAKISLVDILRWFWESHDPTQGMGQGGDRGTQYRSGLYYFDEEQRRLMEASKREYGRCLRESGKTWSPITTEIRAAAEFGNVPGALFYYAEGYHQQYLAKPGSRKYCSAEPLQVSLPPFDTWAPEGLSHHVPKLPEAFWKRHAPKQHCVLDAPHTPIKWP